MPTKPLSAQELRIWHALKLLGEGVMERVERDIVQATGLSGSDFGVLSRLADLGKGEMRQHTLAESLKWNKSRLSHHLTRMQQRQLIERRDIDSRGVLVVLTAQGRGKLDAARPIHAASVRKNLISRLSHDRSESLLTISELLSGEELVRDHL